MTGGPWPKGRSREPERPSVESVEVSEENGKWVDGHTLLRLCPGKVRPQPKMTAEIVVASPEFRKQDELDVFDSSAQRISQ